MTVPFAWSEKIIYLRRNMSSLFITAVKDLSSFEKLVKILFREVYYQHLGFTTRLFSATTNDLSLYEVLKFFHG